MQIVKYPDPFLRRATQPVTQFDAELQALVTSMFEVMYDLRGVGLAGPQVGLDRRLFVLNPTGDRKDRDQEMAFVNPRILSRGKQLEFGDEGCLSVPGIYAEVERPHDVVVAYQDVTGAEGELAADGFLARIIQHEHDHLEGVLFVDRLTPVDKIRVRTKLQDLERQAKVRA